MVPPRSKVISMKGGKFVVIYPKNLSEKYQQAVGLKIDKEEIKYIKEVYGW